LLSAVVFDILKGIVVAVIISGAETLRRVARPHDAIQGHVKGLPACTTSTTTRTRR
jgi:sulfate permease, SulP family